MGVRREFLVQPDSVGEEKLHACNLYQDGLPRRLTQPSQKPFQES